MKLKDKAALITDGASKTGIAIAKRFKEEGAIVALVLGPEASQEETGQWDLILHMGADSKKDVDAAVSAVLEKYGRIDIVVHNNNEVIPESLEDCNDENFESAMAVNAKSAFLYAQAAGAAMKQAGKGCLVFVSSIHDEKPSGAAFAYSIAKGAVKMLVKELVLELGRYNVRANLLSVGPMEGHEKLFYSDISPLYEHAKEKIANGQFVRAEEVANAALFFASDDCPQATGCDLVLDGGFLYSYIIRKRPLQKPEDFMGDSMAMGKNGGGSAG